MKKLTTVQRQILLYITQYQKNQGMPPTTREIMHYFGYKSTNGVRNHLTAIANKGFIRLLAGRSRGIEILAEAEEEFMPTAVVREIPLFDDLINGYATAYNPHYKGVVAVDGLLFSGDPIVCLRVDSNALPETNLLNGDVAIIELDAITNVHDVVAIMAIDGKTLLTRREAQPSDSQLGKVVGVIRKVV